MAGIGRILRRAGCAALAASALMLVSCENALLDYLFKGILYNGWKVATWSTPAPVVDGFTHAQGTAYRNGFPMNMAMGPSGKVHLIGYLTSAHDWVHTTMAPGADRFAQAYDPFDSIGNPGDDLGAQPAMDAPSDDWLYIAYADTSRNLYYQEYSTIGGWDPKELLHTEPVNDIGRAFVFQLIISATFQTHLYYVSNNTLYHTRRTGYTTIAPDPPEVFISDVGSVRAIHRGTADLDFVWSDAAGQNLRHRTFADSTVSTIWTNPTPALQVGEIALDNDADGNLHVVFGTYETADMLDVSAASLHYLTNRGGSWQEKHSITGTTAQGPMALFFPASLDVARDSNGNDHPHLGFTMWRPPFTFLIWYAYWDEGGWHLSDTSIDTVNVNSFWTFPVLLVDAKGIVHISYSWTQSELDRTMMYVRGTPAELQQ